MGFVTALSWQFDAAAAAAGGPTVAWLRLDQPIVAGEEPTDLQRAVAIADVANGVGARLDARIWTYLNTDLSVYLYEPPSGAWLGWRPRRRSATTGSRSAKPCCTPALARSGGSCRTCWCSAAPFRWLSVVDVSRSGGGHRRFRALARCPGPVYSHSGSSSPSGSTSARRRAFAGLGRGSVLTIV